MKLELKHLTPYLPYELEMLDRGRIYKLSSLSVLGMNVTDLHKPILRPLSDLTKQIEVNGEKFVPMRWMENNIDKSISFYQWGIQNLEIDIETENYSQTINLFDGYDAVQKLFEWHFDVFNLIEKGLAIDINTLNQTT